MEDKHKQTICNKTDDISQIVFKNINRNWHKLNLIPQPDEMETEYKKRQMVRYCV